MAERRYVKCVKCGDTIDKRDDYGWIKNDRSGRYTCAACTRGYISGSRTSSPKTNQSYKTSNLPSLTTYKVVGTISKIAGIVIFVLSLLLLLAVPPVGIFFAILGVLFFFFGNAYIKKSKAMTKPEITTEEVIEPQNTSEITTE